MNVPIPGGPDDAGGRRLRPQHASAPGDGRVVIISVSVGAGHDGPAAELGRRLLARGWWVDRPDALRLLPAGVGPALRSLSVLGMRRTPPARSRLLRSCASGVGGRATSMALDRLAAGTVELIGDPPDAVVSTHPLVGQLLGRLRRSGALRAPAISYLTGPAVHPLWWHPDVDLVLAPHASMTDQLVRAAHARPGRATIVETAPATLEHLACSDESGRRSGPPRPDPAEIIHHAAVAHLHGSRPGRVVGPTTVAEDAHSL